MSKFKECLSDGEVKKFVNCFIDYFEEKFDCSVTYISVCAIDSDNAGFVVDMYKEV